MVAATRTREREDDQVVEVAEELDEGAEEAEAVAGSTEEEAAAAAARLVWREESPAGQQMEQYLETLLRNQPRLRRQTKGKEYANIQTKMPKLGGA